MEREKTESKLKQNFDRYNINYESVIINFKYSFFRLEQVEKKLNTLIKTRTEEAQQVSVIKYFCKFNNFS